MYISRMECVQAAVKRHVNLFELWTSCLPSLCLCLDI